MSKFIALFTVLVLSGCLEDAVQSGNTDYDSGGISDADTATDLASDASVDLGDVQDAGLDFADAEADDGPDLPLTCSADCAQGLVCDAPNDACVECLSATDCADGLVCDSQDNICVLCASAMDCGMNETCTEMNTCECAVDTVRCTVDSACTDISECDDPIDFVDTNGDGVDGVLGETIFVSPLGDDANDGLTPTSAVATLAAAMAKADLTNRPVILITKGDFPASGWEVPAINTIRIIAGGYEADFVTQSTTATKITNASSDPTLTVKSSTPVELRSFVLGAPRKPLLRPMLSTLRVDTTELTFVDMRLERGNASDGSEGMDGAVGFGGNMGGNAAAAFGSGGSPGCIGGFSGGSGGNGGVCSLSNGSSPQRGNDGANINGQVNGGNQGTNACGLGSSDPGTGGGKGTDGAPGMAGESGLNANGGGGGGGGGDTSDTGPGGSGGGGGGGGCGGEAAENGGPGGSSAAIRAFDGAVLLGEVELVGGQAGKGGDGGKGGCGGAGGMGGNGSGSGDKRGGDGGAGGRGGNGAGGNGGNAGGIYSVVHDATVTFPNLTITGQASGSPALGGTAGGICSVGGGTKGVAGQDSPPETTLESVF